MTDNGQAASYYVTSSWRSVLQNERKSDSCVIRFIFLVVVAVFVVLLDRAGICENALIV